MVGAASVMVMVGAALVTAMGSGSGTCRTAKRTHVQVIVHGSGLLAIAWAGSREANLDNGTVTKLQVAAM